MDRILLLVGPAGKRGAAKGLAVRIAMGRLGRMPGSARSVLVVDDDEDVRESVAMVLQDEGYQVDTAANGKEALDKLDGMPLPGVVLLDLMMPVMNGWTTLEQLRKRGPRPPVLVVSAAVPPAPSGAAGYLRKPIDLELLLEKVNDALGQ